MIIADRKSESCVQGDLSDDPGTGQTLRMQAKSRLTVG